MTTPLLDRILANPDDRDACLVYADVIGAEDPPRGELIVVEDRLLDATGAERSSLIARRAVLLKSNAERWWPDWSRAYLETSGGFVRGVLADRWTERHAFAQLLKTEPVTRVCVLDGPSRAAPAVLARLRHVELHRRVEALAAGEWLEALPRWLDTLVVHAEVDGPGKLPSARRLALTVRHGHIPMRRVEDWSRVEELAIEGALTEDEVIVLARLDVPRLRRLSLANKPLTARGLYALAAMIPKLPSFEWLDVRGVQVADVEVAAFTALVDACGPRVTILRSYPEAASVDFWLFNRHFTIRADEDDVHAVLIDTFEVAFVYSIHRAPHGRLFETKSYGTRAPLGPLASAIAAGRPIAWGPSTFGPPTARIDARPPHWYELFFDDNQLTITHHH